MSGFTNEATIAAAQRMHLRLVWVKTRLDPEDQLASGAVDLYPRLVPLHPNDKIYFSRPWLRMTYTLLAKSRIPLSAEAMKGVRVGYPDNPFNEAIVSKRLPGAVRFPVKVIGGVMDAICKADVDAGMLETRMIQPLLLRGRVAGCETAQFQLVPLQGETLPASFASHRDFAWAADGLRAAVDDLVRDETLSPMYATWFFPGSNEVAALYHEVVAKQRTIVLSVIIVLLAAVTLLVLWNASRVRRARQLALDASQAKSRFVANVSHELRTPLSGIIGLSQMLLDRHDLTAETRELAALTAQSSQGVVRLLNDLLDLARASEGRLEVTPAPMSLRAAVSETVALVRPAAEAKGCR